MASDAADKTIISYKHPAIFPEVDGVLLMPGTSRELLQCLSKLETRSEDVVIATWPKSGTTWVMEIVWQIYNDAKIDETRIDEKVKFIDALFIPTNPANQKTPDDVIRAFEGLPTPRLLKTHLCYDLVPQGSSEADKPKIILVLRNPRDAFVSYYNHYTGIGVLECDVSWDECFEMMLEGNVVFGSWFDYVRSWWPHRHDPNVLLLRYEDLIKDLPSSIKRIASFVSRDLSEGMLNRIAMQTTFTAMHNRPSFDHSWFGQKPGRKFEFLWRGKSGSWKTCFTEDQNRRFDQKFKEEMTGTGLDMSFFD